MISSSGMQSVTSSYMYNRMVPHGCMSHAWIDELTFPSEQLILSMVAWHARHGQSHHISFANSMLGSMKLVRHFISFICKISPCNTTYCVHG